MVGGRKQNLTVVLVRQYFNNTSDQSRRDTQITRPPVTPCGHRYTRTVVSELRPSSRWCRFDFNTLNRPRRSSVALRDREAHPPSHESCGDKRIANLVPIFSFFADDHGVYAWLTIFNHRRVEDLTMGIWTSDLFIIQFSTTA